MGGNQRSAGGIALVAALALSGCAWFGGDGERDRFVQPGSPKVSPSGHYTAAVDTRAARSGVGTWVAVIIDESGAEVFRDDYAYSTRHGAGITWLSTDDQLWLLSGDVGVAHVDRGSDGRWSKTAVTPETRVPAEIRELIDA
ncbi:hypothetical protein [Mycolicibacterium wolinskyi]|uniref:hypothetical protein n=1 Tax=Mycolicibacterium wolinskyi TaxID=59750 RepID=UPI003917A9C0